MKHGLIHALHKTGAYGLLDQCRDYSELAKASHRQSFSQFGEDLFLLEHFRDRKGFYIEIGGNHPLSLSNTYLLYRMGWSGLVVEPIKRLCAKHKRFRPRDIQVNAAAGESIGNLTFYEMIPSVLSTCDWCEVESMLLAGRAAFFQEYSVPVMTVAELYRLYLAPNPISLLSIDTEGHDMSVLRGIDWDAMSPEMIICEAADESKGSEVTYFLANHAYECVKVFGCNLVFTPR